MKKILALLLAAVLLLSCVACGQQPAQEPTDDPVIADPTEPTEKETFLMASSLELNICLLFIKIRMTARIIIPKYTLNSSDLKKDFFSLKSKE